MSEAGKPVGIPAPAGSDPRGWLQNLQANPPRSDETWYHVSWNGGEVLTPDASVVTTLAAMFGYGDVSWTKVNPLEFLAARN